MLDSLRNLASTVIVIGIGIDGSILQKMVADKLFKSKDVLVLGLPGEEFPALEWPAHWDRIGVSTLAQLQYWMNVNFSDHKDIVRLAGADFIDSHPLCEEAEKFRAEHLPMIHKVLGDRAWALGNDVNDTYLGMYNAAKNAKTLLPMPTLGDLAGRYGCVPTISIGAGPSLRSRLDQLRSLQDRCILVSCDAAYPGLLAEGIVPHFVCPQERLQQQAALLRCAKGTRTVFAGLPVCHKDVVDIFDGRAIYLHCMDKVYDWLVEDPAQRRCLTGSSTGVLSFFVAASLTTGPVYLVGHDLAYDDAGASHWQGAGFSAQAFTKEQKGSGGLGSNGYEERLVAGNGGTPLKSIIWWDIFRNEIAAQIPTIGPRVYNTNAVEGKYAKIEGALAGSLPDPSDLPELDWPHSLKSTDGDLRLQSFRDRVAQLPDDCDRFIAGMRSLQDDIRRVLLGSPRDWDVLSFIERVAPDVGVSAGNKAAFEYILRSALYNEQAYMSYKSRSFKTREEAMYRTYQSLSCLADAMCVAVETLKPSMQEIADESGISSEGIQGTQAVGAGHL